MNREYKEKLSRQIEKNYLELEERIMQDIIRRIHKTGKITSTADYQINRLIILGNSSEDIEKMIKDALKASYPKMFELYDQVINWEYVRNKDIYFTKGIVLSINFFISCSSQKSGQLSPYLLHAPLFVQINLYAPLGSDLSTEKPQQIHLLMCCLH